MEGKLQTSFIPKKPFVDNGANKAPMPISILSVIAWFIFIVALLASGGVYAYEKYLEKAIESKNIELSNRIKSFDKASVDHYVKLNTRLLTAQSILNNHLAVSNLLDLIGENTQKSVQFNDFKYSYEDGPKLSLSMSGRAQDFASVALQSDTFSAQPFLQNQLFANLGLDQQGGVLFKFTANVDPSVLKYTVK